MNELVSRSCKRVFRQYIQSVASSSTGAAVAHFLNCYLSNFTKSSSLASGESGETESKGKKKKKNQKKGQRSNLVESSNDWQSLTSKTLWTQIAEEASAQYHFELNL